MQEDKEISFAEAAKLAGVHINTLRNWRASGRLKTASKAIIDGVPTWIVTLTEVEELVALTKPKKKPRLVGQQSKVVSTPTPIDTPNNSSPEALQGLQAAQAEQSLIIMREALVKPLVDHISKLESEKDTLIRENERQAVRTEELARENEKLKAELEQLKHMASGPAQASRRPWWRIWRKARL